MTSAPVLRRPDQPAAAAVRVLIVDDSAVARAALSQIVAATPMLHVVAALDNARRALDWLANNSVDIVLLDIQMPGLDGIAALPAFVTASGGARILIVSTLAADGARATIEALALGATDTLAKPAPGGLGKQFGQLLVDKMMRLGEALPRTAAKSGEPISLRQDSDTPIACLAIGASTGGLHALAAFFKALPPAFDAPILLTQHLPPAFMPFFAEQLASLSKRPVRVASGCERLRRRMIVVAPGDAHLGVRRTSAAVETRLSHLPQLSRCCPSVDPMFAEVASAYGNTAVGIVLTGMGRDGAIGARAITDAGGTVLAQDAASSAVWGMPGSVAREGLASLVAPPQALAAYVARRGVRS